MRKKEGMMRWNTKERSEMMKKNGNEQKKEIENDEKILKN